MGPIGLPELFILGVVAIPYFIPSIIAAVRQKTNLVAIGVFNLLVGWTVIGWIVALVWALRTDTVDLKPAVVAAQASRLCPHCGKYSPAGAVHCGQCGQRFS